MNRPEKACLTVLYDGSCPLCSREIDWYRGQTSSESICWLDLRQTAQQELPQGVEHGLALERFHVIQPDGTIATGAAAFLRLWRAYPGLGLVARWLSNPVALAVLETGYRLFLPVRPLLAQLLPSRSSKSPKLT